MATINDNAYFPWNRFKYLIYFYITEGVLYFNKYVLKATILVDSF